MKKRESAVSKKINKLLVDDKIKFRGTNANNLKGVLNIMPNFCVVLF